MTDERRSVGNSLVVEENWSLILPPKLPNHYVAYWELRRRPHPAVLKAMTNVTRFVSKGIHSISELLDAFICPLPQHSTNSSIGLSTKSIFCIALVMSLVGCGATENISLGQWKEAGTREPPRVEKPSNIDVSQLARGDGKTVAPGDLVKVRITPIGQALAERVSVLESEGPWDLWLWAGREPDGRKPWINLGNANFRAALIGRSVHERLRIELNEAARKYVRLPLMGGAPDESIESETKYTYKPDDRRLRTWPELAVSRAGALEVEILNSCPGRLNYREGQLEQRAWISKGSVAKFAI